MGRKLTFDRIATTRDSDDPVIRAKFPDTGSKLDAIICRDIEQIRVWYVVSERRGDMKLMMDEITEQTGIRDVQFLSPLPTTNLEDRLHGFEKHKRELPDGRKQEYLEGRWEPDSEKATGET